VGNV
jgi:hypothetical protein